MKELSESLLSVIDSAEPRLREISALESTKPILSGGWSRRQVLGHLIDSASNNHQRFVRAALQPSLDFPATTRMGTFAFRLHRRQIGRCWSRCGLLTTAISRMSLPAYPPQSWTPFAASARESRSLLVFSRQIILRTFCTTSARSGQWTPFRPLRSPHLPVRQSICYCFPIHFLCVSCDVCHRDHWSLRETIPVRRRACLACRGSRAC